jgi:hypothetical protein
VLLMIGINDLADGTAVTDVLGDVESMVWQFQSANANAQLLVM